MTIRYFRHQTCEPGEEITADEAARLANHARRHEGGEGAVVERVQDGAVVEVVYEGIAPDGHAARYGHVPFATVVRAPGRRERVEHRGDGTVATRAVAELDENGRPRVETWSDATGAVRSRDEYTWRGDDLVRVTTHLPDGSTFVAFEDDDA